MDSQKISPASSLTDEGLVSVQIKQKFLQRITDSKQRLENSHYLPEIILLEGSNEEKGRQISTFLDSHSEAQQDNYTDVTGFYFTSYLEKFHSSEYKAVGNNPEELALLRKQKLAEIGISEDEGDFSGWGALVFFPLFRRIAVYPPQDLLYKVRTASNRGLVASEVQKKLKNTSILMVGGSVGATLLWTIFAEGARKLTMYDKDITTPDGANRALPGNFLGVSKSLMLLNLVVGVDPYGDYEFVAENITQENLKDILQRREIEIVADECDSPEIKELLQITCKELEIPEISAGNIGTGVSEFDFYPFDTQPELELFHGVMKKHGFTSEVWGKLPAPIKIALIVGLENVPTEMLQSFQKMLTRELPGFPQNMSTVVLSGAVFGEAIKSWLAGEKLQPRALIRLRDDLLLATDEEKIRQEQERSQLAENILQQLRNIGSMK